MVFVSLAHRCHAQGTLSSNQGNSLYLTTKPTPFTGYLVTCSKGGYQGEIGQSSASLLSTSPVNVTEVPTQGATTASEATAFYNRHGLYGDPHPAPFRPYNPLVNSLNVFNTAASCPFCLKSCPGTFSCYITACLFIHNKVAPVLERANTKSPYGYTVYSKPGTRSGSRDWGWVLMKEKNLSNTTGIFI